MQAHAKITDFFKYKFRSNNPCKSSHILSSNNPIDRCDSSSVFGNALFWFLL